MELDLLGPKYFVLSTEAGFLTSESPLREVPLYRL